MNFKVKNINIEAGANIVLINEHDAALLDIHPGGRLDMKIRQSHTIAIANLTSMIPRGMLGVTKSLGDEMRIKDGDRAEVVAAEQPKSLLAIKERINGKRLGYEDFYEIIKDGLKNELSREELTAFVVALNIYNLDLEEAEHLSNAMVNTGEYLNLGKKRIYDKHSIGGVPGDKTSLLLVPTIAAAGLTIPKTSSRAITSAAGTADRAEVLMPVSLSIAEMKKVVNKTNGCLVWGGEIHMAPADDMFIKIEYPLSIDPLLLPSIISKKRAAGSTDMVLDIPTGETVKIKSKEEANFLAKDFITLGERMGISIRGAVTSGQQPVGHAIGAALEAQEALAVLERKKDVPDLIDKVASLAGILLSMSGKKGGKAIAKKLILNGSSEKKLRQIISEQGGDESIRAEDIKIGEHSMDITSEFDGNVLSIDNIELANAARIAGAPSMKSAGIILHKKLWSEVHKGDTLLTVYSDSAPMLAAAEKYLVSVNPVLVASGSKMLLKEIYEKRFAQRFIIER
ncbi:MAG: AMP phosphorylase [Candidatus Micrarchaeia archaeon]